MSYASDTVQQVLDAYSPGYANGLWQSTSPTWSCVQGGAATAAATLYVIGGRINADMLSKAQKTIDRAITDHRQDDGSFTSDKTQPPNPDLDSSRTVFWVPEMGMTMLLAGADFTPSPGEQSKNKNVLRGIADFWFNEHQLTWYANGNIKLQIAEAFWMIYRATGDPKYLGYYQSMIMNLISPSPGQNGEHRGLVVDTPATKADWSDAVGYFTETGAGGTGYDPEYTMLQLEPAVRMYLLSGDVQMLQFSNMLVNKLLQRVDLTTMRLDASNGTRHTGDNRHPAFMTPALVVLSLFGNRPDLAQYIPAQQAMARGEYLDPINLYNDDYRRGLGNDLCVQALAIDMSQRYSAIH